MEKVKHAQINEAILDANHVLILPDERIDGDSLGAALALYRYLDRSYKKVTILCSAEIPEKYHYLPHIELCRFDRVVLIDESIDLVISVDCSDADYISEIVGALPRPVDLINIDHHETNDRFGEIVQVVTEAASTTEVVYRFFRENNLWIDPDMATALLAGVYFDTTVFSNKSTRDGSLTIASELILLGARVNDVVKFQHTNKSLGMLKIWGVALGRLRAHSSGAVVTWITAADMDEAGVDVEDIDGLSNFLHGVIEADSIIVLREQADGVKVSMRTMSGNVAAIAKMFGGGGHVKAAGFSVPGARITDRNGVVGID
ncbi:bifunctional oligoribonuclease/PAP phosphatase NrnA [Patescibacteria group bacterium]|nr:bifunctional oligoribonuclease/PAP phosphatase NrnA [Patescibacteria group bacterium]MBU1906905.1 bifunctional oligoribonuclease/PAP phosphatase NrnA [Patescibacteria group bacterium]